MKIYFAGQIEDIELLLGLGVKHVLLSFYYMKSMEEDKVSGLFNKLKEKGIELIIDSGAHTFFVKAGLDFGGMDFRAFQQAKEKLNMDEIEKYFLEYLFFMKKHQYGRPVELDIGALVGKEKLLEWREKMKSEGIKFIPVWHKLYCDEKDWEELCQNYDYVAIEGGKEINEYVKFLQVAQKYKTKIHAFAMTKEEFMRRLSFYSVDSTSWKSGSRYGIGYYFSGGKLRSISKEERRRFKSDFEAKGLNWGKIEQDQGDEVDKMNAIAWIEYEKWLNENQQGKYWEESIVSGGESPIVQGAKSKVLPPEETRGKINEIRQRPEVKEKWLESMKNNLFNFKTGKYSKKLPLYCNNCYAGKKCQFYQEPKKEGDKVLCALRKEIFSGWFGADQFDYREEETVMETKSKIITFLLQKLALQSWFEMLDGGIQDKAATMLAGVILNALKEAPKIQIGGTEINVNKKIAIAINNLDDETRRRIIESLRQFESSEQK